MTALCYLVKFEFDNAESNVLYEKPFFVLYMPASYSRSDIYNSMKLMLVVHDLFLHFFQYYLNKCLHYNFFRINLSLFST